MYNNQTFNSSAFNTQFSLGPDVGLSLSYNNFGLQDGTIITSEIDYDNGPATEVNSFNFPRADGGGELSYYFRRRIVTLKGHIKSTTEENLNNTLDSLKQALGVNQSNLDIKVNGTTRRATASCINFNNMFKRKHYHISFVPFEIQFQVLDPFWAETTKQIQTFLTQTTNLAEEALNEGSARTNPVVTITVTSATALSAVSFDSNNETITITQALVASDTLIIDCGEKTVKLNGTEIDYSGVFPHFEVQANSYNVNFTATSFDVDLSVYFFKQYI